MKDNRIIKQMHESWRKEINKIGQGYNERNKVEMQQKSEEYTGVK